MTRCELKIVTPSESTVVIMRDLGERQAHKLALAELTAATAADTYALIRTPSFPCGRLWRLKDGAIVPFHSA